MTDLHFRAITLVSVLEVGVKRRGHRGMESIEEALAIVQVRGGKSERSQCILRLGKTFWIE